jgi:mannose-6-phosphate isomerase-like protein (cupin superfamily)
VNEVVNLERAFGRLTEFWSPKVIGRVNDQYVKVAKIKGSFTWHKHDAEDELFHVIRGRMRIEYPDGGAAELGPGDIHVVPRGTMHCPVADDECWVMLVETTTTQHTGDIVSPLTRSIEDQLV